MAKNISISLVGIVDTVPTKLNYFYNNAEKTTCTFHGTCTMSSDEIRKQLSELALFLSDQGFFCVYDGGETLEVSIAPPDTANMPSSKEEPLFALLARVYSTFKIKSSEDGYYFFLINKNGLSADEMRKVASELESKMLNAEYCDGNNFITVSASTELETFLKSKRKTDDKKNISISSAENSSAKEEVVG